MLSLMGGTGSINPISSMHLQEKRDLLGIQLSPKMENSKMLLSCLFLGSLCCGHTAFCKSNRFSWRLPAFFPAEHLWFGLILPWLVLVFSPEENSKTNFLQNLDCFCQYFTLKSFCFHRSARETGRNPGGAGVQRCFWMYRSILSLYLRADTGAELRLVTSEIFRKCFYINFPCVVLLPRVNM